MGLYFVYVLQARKRMSQGLNLLFFFIVDFVNNMGFALLETSLLRDSFCCISIIIGIFPYTSDLLLKPLFYVTCISLSNFIV